MEREHTDDEVRQREETDATSESSAGSGGAYGPPEFGERANPERDEESLVDRPSPEEENPMPPPGDAGTLGKETRGGT